VTVLGGGVPDQTLTAFLREVGRDFKQLWQVLLFQAGGHRTAFACVNQGIQSHCWHAEIPQEFQEFKQICFVIFEERGIGHEVEFAIYSISHALYCLLPGTLAADHLIVNFGTVRLKGDLDMIKPSFDKPGNVSWVGKFSPVGVETCHEPCLLGISNQFRQIRT